MRLVFNPSNILEVGIRIFQAGVLIKEVIVKRGLKPVYVDIPWTEKSDFMLSLAEPGQLNTPEFPESEKEIGCMEKIGFNIPQKSTFLSACVFGFYYPYKTVIYGLSPEIEALYLDFVPLGDLSVAGIRAVSCVKKSRIVEFENRQEFVRIPTEKKLKQKLMKRMGITLALCLMALPLAAWIVSHVLFADVSNQFQARSYFALGGIGIALLFIPTYAVYYLSKGYYEVLGKCEIISVNTYQKFFSSEYFKENMVDETTTT